MASDIVEKENVRDYNKSMAKQKNNKFDENKSKKQPRARRDHGDFDEDTES